jgi:riboflavin kinase / FMN adenylyltransferase
VRGALAEGDVERVNFLLGRRYSLHGPVVYGDQRGRQIGFPTANLAMAADRTVPAFGVYAACAYVNEGAYAAAVNIGMRPTFNKTTPTIEAHLLDFDGDIYGSELRLDFVRRLRGEVKFAGIAELTAQIAKDVAATRTVADCVHPASS